MSHYARKIQITQRRIKKLEAMLAELTKGSHRWRDINAELDTELCNLAYYRRVETGM